MPPDLPENLRSLYFWRRKQIEQEKNLKLLETKVYKRLWQGVRGVFGHGAKTWPEKISDACGEWLLDRVEEIFSSASEAKLYSLRQLSKILNRDARVRAVAEVYSEQTDPDLEKLLEGLVKPEAVPYLAAMRYKPSGMKKYRAWQKTWEKQREEDAWEAADPQTRGPRPEVPLPPKYGSGDFLRPEYYRSRGKLDVPKERFIAYPGAEDEGDPSPIVGWAGWDHADRMAALGSLVEGAEGEEKVTPLLAGMQELLPWVKQWHGEDDRYGTPLGQMWAGYLAGLQVTHKLSDKDLEGWRPEKKQRGRRGGGGRKKAAPVSREAAAAAFEALEDGEGVSREALAEHLGVTQARVKAAAEALVAAGPGVVLKKRPVVYGRSE